MNDDPMVVIDGSKQRSQLRQIPTNTDIAGRLHLDLRQITTFGVSWAHELPIQSQIKGYLFIFLLYFYYSLVLFLA
jgi:hypothetical protein